MLQIAIRNQSALGWLLDDHLSAWYDGSAFKLLVLIVNVAGSVDFIDTFHLFQKRCEDALHCKVTGDEAGVGSIHSCS